MDGQTVGDAHNIYFSNIHRFTEYKILDLVRMNTVKYFCYSKHVNGAFRDH